MKLQHAKEGRYIKPTRPIEHHAKIAYVLITFIPEGQTEKVPARYRSGTVEKEEIPFVENKLDLVKLHFAALKHFNPGVAFDLIVVDNSTPDEEGDKWIKRYCEENDIKYHKRPNIGFAFGAGNFIWDMYGDEYLFYMFTEQDFMPCRDNWLSDILLDYMKDPDIGYAGNVVEGPRSRDYFEKWGVYEPKYMGEYWEKSGDDFVHYNTDGMTSFVSSDVLKKVGGYTIVDMEVIGDNPMDMGHWDVTPGINEMFYQHSVLDHGYKLVPYGGKEGQQYTNGICYADFGDDTEIANLPPMIHGQTIYCNKLVRPIWSWYEGFDNFKFYE